VADDENDIVVLLSRFYKMKRVRRLVVSSQCTTFRCVCVRQLCGRHNSWVHEKLSNEQQDIHTHTHLTDNSFFRLPVAMSVALDPAALRAIIQNAGTSTSTADAPAPNTTSSVLPAAPALKPAEPSSSTSIVASSATIAGAAGVGLFKWFNYKWAIGLLIGVGLLVWLGLQAWQWWINRKKKSSQNDGEDDDGPGSSVAASSATPSSASASASAPASASASVPASAPPAQTKAPASASQKRDYSLVDEL
jgi:hypothetical protein